MNFNEHSELEGRHAFLSASKYSWLNYDLDKLSESYSNFLAAQRGTQLNDFAKQCILLNQRLPKVKKTLNMYVNDAIGYKMTPEQPLYYSENCFGTADSISYRNKNLRIHDLKTGVTKVSMNQLYIYAALFCLEYKVNPFDISIVLRIYQSNDFIEEKPESKLISDISKKIITFDEAIDKMKSEEL